MDRRSFFKGMFGAAAIAALPKPVLDKMVEEPVTQPSRLHEINEVGKVERGCPFDESLPSYIGKDGLVFYKGDQLVATSYTFSLGMKCDFVDVTSLDSPHYPKWILANRSWQLSTQRINWFANPEEILLTQESLNFIMKNKDCQMTGEVMLSCMETSLQIGHPKYQNCIFEGSGNVTIVVENHDKRN